jgi:hypothetical protein
MTRITIDAETEAKLTGTADLVEVCDSAGKRLGYFVPPGFLKYLSPYSDEQIRDLRAQRTGRPLKEILKDLESRA